MLVSIQWQGGGTSLRINQPWQSQSLVRPMGGDFGMIGTHLFYLVIVFCLDLWTECKRSVNSTGRGFHCIYGQTGTHANSLWHTHTIPFRSTKWISHKKDHFKINLVRYGVYSHCTSWTIHVTWSSGCKKNGFWCLDIVPWGYRTHFPICEYPPFPINCRLRHISSIKTIKWTFSSAFKKQSYVSPFTTLEKTTLVPITKHVTDSQPGQTSRWLIGWQWQERVSTLAGSWCWVGEGVLNQFCPYCKPCGVPTLPLPRPASIDQCELSIMRNINLYWSYWLAWPWQKASDRHRTPKCSSLAACPVL